MPSVTVSESVPIPLAEAWPLVSDLSRFDEWLELHEGWRGELPEEIEAGVELTSVVSMKGLRNRVTWTVEEFSPPQRIALTGDGKGGTKVELSLSAADEGERTRIELHAEFSNPALRGPMGGIASRGLKGELERSLARLVELTG